MHQSMMSMMVLAFHSCPFGESFSETNKKTTPTPPSKSLIKNIRLLTSVSLDKMKAFYSGKLGLQLIRETKSEIHFQAGDSSLTFVKIQSQDSPWYHFAFNIPENKLRLALQWQANKTAIIPTPLRARDAKYPEKVRHFPHWNAHSIFFYDPAGNLLEYIARHDLKNAQKGAFSSKDLLNISEIAFVVDDQHETAKLFHQELGLDVYPKGQTRWWAMGDENGLLLAIPKRIWGENTAQPKRFKIYKTEATIYGSKPLQIQVKGYPYEVFQIER